jgi:hypothetical protein
MKYILVTGGVISGVGKGVIASSFGTILKSCGIAVTSLKIDPYINIDAGTFSPFEHGKTHFSILFFITYCLRLCWREKMAINHQLSFVAFFSPYDPHLYFILLLILVS